MRTLTQFLTGNINEGRFEKNKKTLGLFFAWYFLYQPYVLELTWLPMVVKK